MINEIDYNKYIVIKNDDIRCLTLTQVGMLNSILDKIKHYRKDSGKQENLYLVLNVEDKFDVQYLWSKLTNVSIHTPIIKIKDVAIHIVNSILKMK